MNQGALPMNSPHHIHPITFTLPLTFESMLGSHFECARAEDEGLAGGSGGSGREGGAGGGSDR